MAITLVQPVVHNYVAGQNPTNLPFAQAMTAGKNILYLAAYFAVAAGPITQVNDDAGNSYNRIFGPLNSGTNNELIYEIWLATHTLAYAPTGNRVDPIMTDNFSLALIDHYGFELDSPGGFLVGDKSVTHLTASSSTGNTGTTPLTSFINEILLAFGSPSGGPCVSPGAPWTDAGVSTSSGSAVAYQIVTAKGTYTADFTDGVDEWWSGIVTAGDGAGAGDVVTVTGKYQLR